MRILFLLLALWLPALASAHKSSDSYLSLAVLDDGGVHGRWDIALRDLDLLLPLDGDGDRRLTWGELQAATPALHALAAQVLQLRAGGEACTLRSDTAPVAIEERVDGRYAVLTLQGACAPGRDLELSYGLLDGVDAAHRGIASVLVQGREQALVLSPGQQLPLGEDARVGNWLAQVRDGMHHIATGYDHLLFLFSLLLPVALLGAGGGRAAWRDTVLLVTAFTLAHSLTLALATFDLLRLPGRWVEAAIAASVLIAALHNLIEHAPRTRWIMAFVFGLVHGLGFAAMLGELPAATGPRLLALAGFNLGVEAGQLLAVAVFLPFALWLARRDRLVYRRWGVQGGSLAIAAVATVWLCQRLLDWQLIPG